MGVDVVIAVDVGFPLLPRQQLSSAPVISSQMLAILIRRNAQAQLATLTPQDILIQPALGDASSFDFGIVARVIGVGEAAARGKAEQLAALSVSEQDMQRYVQRREAPRAPPPRIDFVRVDPGSERYGPPNSLFDGLTGKPLDPDAVARRVTALYGRGGLDTLDYHVIGDESRYGLALDARPNSQGPNYLRFGSACRTTSRATPLITPPYAFVMADITRNAGEWVTDLQIGTICRFRASCSCRWRSFPAGSSCRMRRTRVATWTCCRDRTCWRSTAYTGSTMDWISGINLATGERYAPACSANRVISALKSATPADPGLPQRSFAPFNTRDYFVRFTYDRLDDVNFPHRGQRRPCSGAVYATPAAPSRPPIR